LGGATITDALEAGALEAFGNDSTRGLLTNKAGMDILLASARNVTQGESVVDILVASWEDVSLDRHALNQGTERIMSVRGEIVYELTIQNWDVDMIHLASVLRTYLQPVIGFVQRVVSNNCVHNFKLVS
jgi:hypothetical protein